MRRSINSSREHKKKSNYRCMANKHSVAEFIKDFYPQYWGFESYPAEKCCCIRKVSEEFGIFSNFGTLPLTVEGITFRNSEHLFQMMKFKDAQPLFDIYPAYGRGLKMKAKSWEGKGFRRDDWGKIFIDCLRYVLTVKYEQIPEFREALELSKGKFIVEDQTGRVKIPDAYGVILDAEQNIYKGPNLLGRLLMELRDRQGQLDYLLPDDAFDFIQILKK